MMTFDLSDLAEKFAERKESARRTLRDVSSKEVHDLVLHLFPDTNHPFAEPVERFVEEHKTERAVRGETSDGASFIYYPQANQGIWYTQKEGSLSVGLLASRSLQALAELTREMGKH
jgi:hypothetical protein